MTEGGSVAAYKAMRFYWRSHGYVRLVPPVQARPDRGCRNTRKVRLTPKVKIFKFITSPKEALLRLRDGYMGMMLGLANSSICTRGSGGGGYYRGRTTSYIDQAGYGFGKAPLKEYDMKAIVKIYRTVIAAAEGKLGSP